QRLTRSEPFAARAGRVLLRALPRDLERISMAQKASSVGKQDMVMALARSETQDRKVFPYLALEPTEVFGRLRSRPEGLSAKDAAIRLKESGRNELPEQRTLSRARVLLWQLRSPLLLLLFFAAAVSAMSGEWRDAVIVLAIVLASVGIGYQREYS